MSFQVTDFEASAEFLYSYDWPSGLVDAFHIHSNQIALRFVLVDNSASMLRNDGYKIITNEGITKMIPCTRWEELTSTLIFFAQLMEAAKSPTEFRFLNQYDPILIGTGADSGAGYRLLLERFSTNPLEETPLCQQVAQIISEIEIFSPMLIQQQKRATIIIATDGEPSDGNLGELLTRLLPHPVSIVVRVCTSDRSVLDYWNGLDRELDLSLDVVDDLFNESKQIYELNPWLTYGEPMHRMRELGFHLPQLDRLDEIAFTANDIHDLAVFLFFGGDQDQLPKPEENWSEFVQKLTKALDDVPETYDVLSKEFDQWIRIKRLKAIYKNKMNEKCLMM